MESLPHPLSKYKHGVKFTKYDCPPLSLFVRFHANDVSGAWASAGAGKTGISPLEIGVKNHKFLESLNEQLISDYFILVLQRQFVFVYGTRNVQVPVSQFGCHAVMSLQFTHVHIFACRGRLRRLRVDCYEACNCWSLLRNNNIAPNLNRFASGYCSRRVAVCDCRTSAGNALRQCLLTDDSGKPFNFMLCEKKHEWICSNASTSLKNQLLLWDCECDQCA